MASPGALVFHLPILFLFFASSFRVDDVIAVGVVEHKRHDRLVGEGGRRRRAAARTRVAREAARPRVTSVALTKRWNRLRSRKLFWHFKSKSCKFHLSNIHFGHHSGVIIEFLLKRKFEYTWKILSHFGIGFKFSLLNYLPVSLVLTPRPLI